MGTRRQGAARLLAGAAMLVVLLVACGARQPKTSVVGIISDGMGNDAIVEGFKAELAAQGYGGRVSYVEQGYVGADEAHAKLVASRVLAAKPSAVLVLGGRSFSAVAQIGDTKAPLVMAPVQASRLPEAIQSMGHPGGNATGVSGDIDYGKMLEWIRRAAPAVTTLLMPFDPATIPKPSSLDPIVDAATPYGIHILGRELEYPAGMGEAIAELPPGSGILLRPTHVSIAGFVTHATAASVPVFSFMSPHLEEGALLVLSLADRAMGRQAARQMVMIFRGSSPAVIPVESADLSCSLNLRAERALGLRVPEEAIRQADTVLR